MQQKHLIATLSATKIEIDSAELLLRDSTALETQYIQSKQALDKAHNQLDMKRQELWKRTAENDFLSQRHRILELQIEELKALRSLVDERIKLQHWLTTFFIPLQRTLERHMLLRLHYHFESSFTRWHSLLMEGHDLNARVDDSFTPAMFLQGIQSDYSNLSGGEKTSVALAFRLALNDCLTQHHQLIHAKDLLILDEPTDGFSSEQFARLGEILQQLNLSQLILVSHEPQLEGFAEHTLRVEKVSGRSKIYALH